MKRLKTTVAALALLLASSAGGPPAVSDSVDPCSVLIPGTAIGVGATCLPATAYPALNNPHDPVDYGADPTGVSDSTGAIVAALANGDVVFNRPGTYLVDLAYNSKIQFSNRVFECVPGVTLYAPILQAGTSFGAILFATGNSIIIGCHFQGGNVAGAIGATCTGPGGPCQIAPNSGQLLVSISGANNIVEGNYFQDNWGDTALLVSNLGGSNSVASDWLVRYNTFTHNPYFGLNVESTIGGTAEFNDIQDGQFGSEFDGCNNLADNITQNVVYRYNYFHVSVGDCYSAGCTGGSCSCKPKSGIVVGDDATGCNNFTSIIACNYCAGNSIQSAEVRRSDDNASPSYDWPTAYNNMLGGYCSCDQPGCDSSQPLSFNQNHCD